MFQHCNREQVTWIELLGFICFDCMPYGNLKFSRSTLKFFHDLFTLSMQCLLHRYTWVKSTLLANLQETRKTAPKHSITNCMEGSIIAARTLIDFTL